MRFTYGIYLLFILAITLSGCHRTEKGPSQATDGHPSEASTLAYSERDSPPGDSIIQSYFSKEYSIHIVKNIYGNDAVLFPEDMWMTIYNSTGRTIMPFDATWYPDLTRGLFPLEPEWPDYFLVHEYNLGNCCTCEGDYLLKVTADEIKVIGLVNDYKDGKFYVNICDWPINKSHVEMTLTVHEAPLINDTLIYPENWNY